jgi:hypothetical protein
MAVVVPQQNRSAGTYQGALDVTPGTTAISASLLMAQAEIDDPANAVTFTVEGDWGAGFEPVAGPIDWVGGGPVRPGQTRTAPGFTYETTSRVMPTTLRATVTTNRRWVWGVDLTVA